MIVWQDVLTWDGSVAGLFGEESDSSDEEEEPEQEDEDDDEEELQHEGEDEDEEQQQDFAEEPAVKRQRVRRDAMSKMWSLMVQSQVLT